jgi:hypothetical protein
VRESVILTNQQPEKGKRREGERREKGEKRDRRAED